MYIIGSLTVHMHLQKSRMIFLVKISVITGTRNLCDYMARMMILKFPCSLIHKLNNFVILLEKHWDKQLLTLDVQGQFVDESG